VKKIRNTAKGFTLIELLVVIIIIAIVSTIGANNFKSNRSYARYTDSIIEVMEMIKTARNYAVTSYSYWDSNSKKNIVPEYGYGVYIEQNDHPQNSKIILFANTFVDTFEEQNQYDSSNDLILKEYILPLDTVFIGLSTDKKTPHATIGGTDNKENKAVIIFKPPLAEAILAVNDSPLPETLINLNDLYLEFKRDGSHKDIPSKYIHINKIAGFPEIE